MSRIFFYLPSADRWACLSYALFISRKALFKTLSKFSSWARISLETNKQTKN